MIARHPIRALTTGLLATLLFATAGLCQQPISIPGLGSLSFPNSGAAAAQDDFLRGVLLLHSFEYGQAAEAFRRAQDIDPDFALAYWGEAMTYTHPVWNEKDAEAARAVLNRLAPTPEQRAAKAGTARERAYLTAVETLYGEGEKAALDTLYEVEMRNLAAAYPDDREAQAFHALSLLGLSQGDRDVPTYMEAGAIALDVFRAHPGHPGAAHYVIHAFDDPTHAILAMDAARAYAEVAPEAAHAQHMTTHIFLARGMWDDVVEANIRADRVSDAARMERGGAASSCGHYNEWLMYGLQQQGRYDAAAELLAECAAQARAEARPGAVSRSAATSYVYMRALHLADTRDWSGEAARTRIELDESARVAQLMQAWGNGVAALGRGDRASAESSLEMLRPSDTPAELEYLGRYLPVWRGTLSAMLRAEAGRLEDAIAAAHEAAEYEAALPVDFGPPVSFKPARELEGELLLEAGRATEATEAFRLALGRTPNRILSLAGYARAAEAAGRPQVAARAFGQLAELLARADEDSPESNAAKAYLEVATRVRSQGSSTSGPASQFSSSSLVAPSISPRPRQATISSCWSAEGDDGGRCTSRMKATS